MYFYRFIDFVDIARRSSARGLQLHYTAWRGFVSDSWAFLLYIYCTMNEAYSAYPYESLTTMQHHTDKYSTTWTAQYILLNFRVKMFSLCLRPNGCTAVVCIDTWQHMGTYHRPIPNSTIVDLLGAPLLPKGDSQNAEHLPRCRIIPSCFSGDTSMSALGCKPSVCPSVCSSRACMPFTGNRRDVK